MAGGHEEDAGFWPGYVAAVSGLVQGLLIMAMALGISIYALGQLAVDADRTARAKRSAAAGEETGALPMPNAPSPPPELRTSPPATMASGGALRPPEAIVARISFFDDAVDLPDASAADVATIVAAHRAGGAARWRLMLGAELGNPRARRAGFLRLLAVRKVLLGTGVEADRVQLQLVEGGAASGPGIVELIPLTATGQPLLGQP
jgi:hypothetical protein